MLFGNKHWKSKFIFCKFVQKKLKEEINDISPLDVSEILKEIEDSSSIHL